MTVQTRPTVISPADFAFPLNVYARLLELEDGQADYLHYGLFANAGMSASAAQQNASDLLWQHLPPPCKLLDVGLGLGTTLRRLIDTGYDAIGITPDTTQIAFAQSRHGVGLPALPFRFEDFDQDAGQWRAILFQESGQYIDDIDLFARASHLLDATGEIVVMDEFLLRRDDEAPGNFHFLEHFLRLAERFGFETVTRLDLSRQAAPTVDWLLAGTRRHAATLRDELGVNTAQLDALDASNAAYKTRYADGRYGYFLLRFRRASRPRWLPGRLGDAQQAEMRTLFGTVFGHEMSAAHWQWKYGDGRGLGIGVWQRSHGAGATGTAPALVAHYGGVTREIVCFGQPARALQCVDVMVAKTGRGSLSRQGPVFLSAATCLEHDIGYGTRHLLGFGFPNERAYRLPEHLGLYALVGRMVEINWQPLAARPAMRLAVRKLNPADRDADAKMNACWTAMQTSLPEAIVGVRNAPYLRHRYFAHPDNTYQIYIVQRRFGGAPLGLLVLREINDPASGERRCELLDVIGAVQAMPVLIHHARRIAAGLNCSGLFAWVSDNILPRLALTADAEVIDLKICVPGNQWTPGPSIDKQKGKWWLTGGDTDFR